MNAGGRGVGIAAGEGEGVTVVVVTVLVLEHAAAVVVKVFWEHLHVSISARLQHICSSYIHFHKYFKRLYYFKRHPLFCG